MKLIDSKFASLIEAVNVTNFGVVYFFKEFILTEINEGEVFTSEYSEKLTKLISEHYGEFTNLHVISNRINNYTVEPTFWLEFNKTKNTSALKSVSFVYYNEWTYSNAKLEQTFIPCKTACYKSLQDAIHHCLNIKDKRIA